MSSGRPAGTGTDPISLCVVIESDIAKLSQIVDLYRSAFKVGYPALQHSAVDALNHQVGVIRGRVAALHEATTRTFGDPDGNPVYAQQADASEDYTAS